MPAPNFLPLPRVTHPKSPGQTDRLPTLPGPWAGPAASRKLPVGPTADTTEVDFDGVFALNVKAPYSWSPSWRRRWQSGATARSST